MLAQQREFAINMKHYIISLTAMYVLLCLSGITVVCIGILADFDMYINPFLIIIGGVMAFAGGFFLMDKLISHRLEETVPPKWKIYSEIASYLKWAIMELLIVGFALGYWVVAIYIVRVVSPPR